MDEELSELQEALALVKVLTLSLFFCWNILNCSNQGFYNKTLIFLFVGLS